jgi:D-serine deaminase-like pyridoxal phosphate-dependent protein
MEGVRLQAGQSSKDVKLVVSTIAEFEFILPVLQEFKDAGRHVNVLYGIPLLASQVSRLAVIARQLGPNSICVLVDHASQLDFLVRLYKEAGSAASVYLKVDTGYHRAGLPPSGFSKDDLIPRLMKLEGQGEACFVGLYSHSSLSYNDSTAKQAMANLEGEISGCIDTLSLNAHLFPSDKEITISVGASPQVTSVENLLAPSGDISEDAENLRTTLRKVTSGKPHGFSTRLELHAGVYSILDVQQMSTRSRVHLGDYEDEVAISVVAEVCSVYNSGEREQPEALAAVGVLGLGREPCVAYKGWGIIDRGSYSLGTIPEHRLIISRVSQEHCIVAWAEEAASNSPIPLEVSQSIRIYPNHACVTGALYGWYLVVDSSQDGNRATEIVDVWVRASGW